MKKEHSLSWTASDLGRRSFSGKYSLEVQGPLIFISTGGRAGVSGGGVCQKWTTSGINGRC